MGTLILLTGLGAKLVMAVLLGLSVWSVAIMVERKRALDGVQSKDLRAAKESIQAKDWGGLQGVLQKGNSLAFRALRGCLKAYPQPSEQTLDRYIAGYLCEEKASLEKGLPVLATLGSNAPFIGLFGTVLGIIQAFGVLSTGSLGTTSVMAALSEALVATAVGLFVAIPAVVSYNVFSRKVKTAVAQTIALRDFYGAETSRGKSAG